MANNKPAFSITDQIDLLKQRGMLFRDESTAHHFFANISYYRLKGYWWDMQDDLHTHIFKTNTYFEDILDRYNFDRRLRLILFDAIERIEIALRTKMIYILSMNFGGLWYLDTSIFQTTVLEINGVSKTLHMHTVNELKKEFNRSQEIFIKDQKTRFPGQDADAWKILEVASLGTLSKLYKSLSHQLPEKAKIANGMGLNLHNELSSWLEGITYLRNIIAHHSRLWSRSMVKTPLRLNNPSGIWFTSNLMAVQIKKPFLLISCLVYLCNEVTPGHQIKNKILSLFADFPNVQIYKLGFINNWKNTPVWS
ncbi:Abi family protein [Albibacterium bauzanense]|uniref:Abortive infection bacteriophage resistance protein n=1 Tax=Albibacterium bauzanense TaxID=653929 RepID=A0A4R1M1D1_9SPHI|nr:Abi family protein [Albibacterium bauzanense]TCK85766.1 abortive infection bacteriophage resistance protein [Albibacterium bauzanense]